MTSEEAIKYLEKADVTVYQEPKTKTAEALEMAIESLKHIPCYLDSPCEYQNPDIKIPNTDCIVWHPYPQEKPSDGYYNVTLKYSKCTATAYYNTENDEWHGGNGFGFYVPNRCITAWAELPKPYEEGGE